MNRLWPALLPELRQFPSAEQDEALNAARHTALDFIELLGMAAGLVAVTAITRYALDDASISTHIASTLLNFVVALPLLTLALGPFHLRRLRRGLRERLRSRGHR
jgi:hypothetical protein